MIWQEIESSVCAPYATFARESQGRKHQEEDHPYRSPFQRDRDRIIHSAAFRRLEYKTQVFIYKKADYFRTRLTHTIEVSQIARTIGQALRLNNDLIEAISLAHDLGHPPFGHSGEEILNNLMSTQGGFEHNWQSLRIVDLLEDRYLGFNGLNLTWEVREGLIKHSKAYNSLEELHNEYGLTPPSLEAKVVDIADSIAYLCHDIDDGITCGLFTVMDVLDTVPLIKTAANIDVENYYNDMAYMLKYHLIRRMITLFVDDIVGVLQGALSEHNPQSSDDARKIVGHGIGFSQNVANAFDDAYAFLNERMYFNPRVKRAAQKARVVLEGLFEAYLADPGLMPERFLNHAGQVGEMRAVCDYISGMTDRYAIDEYKKLFDIDETL